MIKKEYKKRISGNRAGKLKVELLIGKEGKVSGEEEGLYIRLRDR